jgi:hypothetical protein
VRRGFNRSGSAYQGTGLGGRLGISMLPGLRVLDQLGHCCGHLGVADEMEASPESVPRPGEAQKPLGAHLGPQSVPQADATKTQRNRLPCLS